jgi:hypothetical protein
MTMSPVMVSDALEGAAKNQTMVTDGDHADKVIDAVIRAIHRNAAGKVVK